MKAPPPPPPPRPAGRMGNATVSSAGDIENSDSQSIGGELMRDLAERHPDVAAAMESDLERQRKEKGEREEVRQ